MKNFLIFITALFLTISTSGVATAELVQSCTQMACVSGLNVSFTADASVPASWPTGNYTFDVDMDGRKVTCKGVLPLRADCESSIVCDGEGIQIGESGCALPPAEQFFYGLQSMDIPQHLKLTITHDGGRFISHDAPVTQNCAEPPQTMCEQTMCCSAMISIPVIWQEKTP